MSDSFLPAPASPPRDGRLARWGRLTLKELRETLRDRRTIITLVFMPLLVYPLLGVAFNKYLLTTLKPPGEPVFRVGVENHAQREVIEFYLLLGEWSLDNEREAHRLHVDERRGKTISPEHRSKLEMIALRRIDSRFEITLSEDLESDVAEGTVDLGIRIPPEYANRDAIAWQNPQVTIPFELIHSRDSPLGRRAAADAEIVLNAVNDFVRVRRLYQVGVQRHSVPAHPVIRAIDTTGAGTPFSLGALVPLILILMTITGAVYPAIDLTAGERERGTLEMLVAAPVPRMGLLLAKYAAVVLVAVLTATVNLVSMTLTIYATGLGTMLFGKGGLSIVVVAQVFGLMILFAMFFAALLLALTSFARSFKEAQAYLIPLMLVSIAPGVFSMMPDLKLEGLLVVTPLANIVLLARDLFHGEVEAAAAVAVVLSTVVYALAAILVAARIFGTDAILYGSPGTWSELFRRPEESAPACTPLTAVLMLAVAFPLAFLLNQFAAQLFLSSLPSRLAASGVVTVSIFGGLPLAVAIARRIRFREAFSLRAPHPLAISGAILLGLSLWPFAYELILAAEELGIVAVNEQVKQLAAKLIEQLQEVPPSLVLFTLAVLPAMFEEWFFRGMFLSSLRTRTNAVQAVLLSAFAFAAFHVIIHHHLAIERFLPSFLLGVILGWLCLRTGSLWPGVILHVCHNGLLLSLIYYKDTLRDWGIGDVEMEHLPWPWLLSAAVAVAAGVFAVINARPATEPAET